MKKTTFFSLFFILTFGTGFAFGQSKNAETMTIKTKIDCDHCLKCESCGGRLNAALKEVWGIKRIKIDPQANSIMVVYKPSKTNPTQIKKAISEAGYDADEVKALPDAYLKLDECCKKNKKI